ncbi:MAG TPA: acetate--CoA ligase, partial [Nitrospira sp.]|nr:acetate--CoA ligase [Nitrospira sp.]
MPWNPIIKSRRDWETIPNLHDYESVRKDFSWEQARAELDGLPDGQGLNIAHEAVVRHATGP